MFECTSIDNDPKTAQTNLEMFFFDGFALTMAIKADVDHLHELKPVMTHLQNEPRNKSFSMVDESEEVKYLFLTCWP